MLKKLIKNNILYSFSSLVLLLIPQLLLIPLITDKYGISNYGKYFLFITIVTFTQQLVKQSYYPRLTGDGKVLGKKGGTIFLDQIDLILFPVWALVVAFVVIASFLYIEMKITLIASAIVVIFASLLAICERLQFTLQVDLEYKYTYGSNVLNQYIILFSVYFLANDISQVCFSYLLAFVITRLLILIKVLKSYSLTVGRIEARDIEQYILIATGIACLGLILGMNQFGVRYAVEVSSGFEMLGYLGILLAPSNLIRNSLTSVLSFLTPLYKRAAVGNLFTYVLFPTYVIIALNIFAFITLLLLSGHLLELWVGQEYVFLSEYMALLFAGTAILSMANPVVSFLRSKNHVKYLLSSYSVSFLFVPIVIILANNKIFGSIENITIYYFITNTTFLAMCLYFGTKSLKKYAPK